jgi:hypothetical protein
MFSCKILYVEVFADRIDLCDEYGSLITGFENIGKWKGDFFSSFSSSEVEKEIEKWWQKKLGLEE